MDIAQCCYWHRVNDDVFETCVNTFAKHSKALLQVNSDDRVNDLSKDYGIRWVNVPKREVAGRRALCKIEQLARLVGQLKDGDRLMVMDADLYFLDDPFNAFEKDFDLAVTTRCHEYRYPINGGVFYFRINKKTRTLVDFYLMQCKDPTWPPLVKFRSTGRNGRVLSKQKKYNPDWEIGQDFLCAVWENGLNPEVGGKVIDLGPEYNYCPNTDVYGRKKAQEMIECAYRLKTVKTLHLKSELKLCIYDGYMEDAITKRCNSKWNWYENKPVIQPQRQGDKRRQLEVEQS